MQLKYIVNGIGIYLEESDDEAWNVSLANRLRYDLDTSLAKISEEEIKQKLIIRRYPSNNNEISGTIVYPANATYNNDLYDNSRFPAALRESDNLLELWVSAGPFPSVKYLLQILYLQRNMAFIHSASLSVNGKGILLPAFAGVGKSSLVFEALKSKGIKLLGDDFCITDDKGFLYPFLQPFSMYPYHRSIFPDYFKGVKIKFVRVNLWNRGMKILKRKLKIPDSTVFHHTLVPPSLLFKEEQLEQKRVALDSLYVLRIRKNIKDMLCSRIDDMNKVVNFCISVVALEFTEIAELHFISLALKEESLATYYKRLEDIIRASLSKIDNHYVIDIPQDMKPSDVAQGLFDIVIKPNL